MWNDCHILNTNIQYNYLSIIYIFLKKDYLTFGYLSCLDFVMRNFYSCYYHIMELSLSRSLSCPPTRFPLFNAVHIFIHIWFVNTQDFRNASMFPWKETAVVLGQGLIKNLGWMIIVENKHPCIFKNTVRPCRCFIVGSLCHVWLGREIRDLNLSE